MIHECDEADILKAINDLIYQETVEEHLETKQFNGMQLMKFKVAADDFQTIKIQLRALGLITKSTKSRSVKDTSTYWTLTPYGDNAMTRLRAIPKADSIRADSGKP